jgi:hypothetical protein
MSEFFAPRSGRIAKALGANEIPFLVYRRVPNTGVADFHSYVSNSILKNRGYLSSMQVYPPSSKNKWA